MECSVDLGDANCTHPSSSCTHVVSLDADVCLCVRHARKNVSEAAGVSCLWKGKQSVQAGAERGGSSAARLVNSNNWPKERDVRGKICNYSLAAFCCSPCVSASSFLNASLPLCLFSEMRRDSFTSLSGFHRLYFCRIIDFIFPYCV